MDRDRDTAGNRATRYSEEVFDEGHEDVEDKLRALEE